MLTLRYYMDIVDQGFFQAKEIKLKRLKHTIKRIVKELLIKNKLIKQKYDYKL